ncbi:alpha-1,2-fucosyltransferase [Flavobacterium franklandianum]|uniref:Alpha-1,2-fucosyltransferase n=1 Tax=Flavobacterium franklandianum TaxID=2594430 RepID=A0A553CK81_9FLAO|nr:alpha-1,2-fucosyltransferase [Flavobacterium franklandianum]TRX20910.1 alpha-1,2-fucosyltransferase [Flavobacterium franklandianum]TRX23148.1 alpha-1,2-fucosyltransferase [Flavobacterium franklandianum]
MLIIKLQGGLGNQMFQYAFASILAQKNKTKVVIEGSIFERVEKTPGFTPRKFELFIFDNQYDRVSESDVISFHHLSKINKAKKKIGLNYPKIYNEPSFGFQTDALSIKSPVYLKGYFQSCKYLIGYENFIRELFSFPVDTLDEINKELLIKIKNFNSIAIHIRRGDYVNDKMTAEYHGSCGLDYYLEAIKLMASKNKDFTLVFFSDDSDWVKEQFNDLPYPKIVVEHNKGEDSWKDMLLMSSCHHNIIANSSFSWWSAWLNINSDKTVIAPKKWFETKDLNTQTLLPEEWIKL